MQEEMEVIAARENANYDSRDGVSASASGASLGASRVRFMLGDSSIDDEDENSEMPP